MIGWLRKLLGGPSPVAAADVRSTPGPAPRAADAELRRGEPASAARQRPVDPYYGASAPTSPPAGGGDAPAPAAMAAAAGGALVVGWAIGHKTAEGSPDDAAGTGAAKTATEETAGVPAPAASGSGEASPAEYGGGTGGEGTVEPTGAGGARGEVETAGETGGEATPDDGDAGGGEDGGGPDGGGDG